MTSIYHLFFVAFFTSIYYKLAVLRVFWEPFAPHPTTLRPFQGIHKIKTISLVKLKFFLPGLLILLLLFTSVCMTCDEIILKGEWNMCLSILVFLKCLRLNF